MFLNKKIRNYSSVLLISALVLLSACSAITGSDDEGDDDGDDEPVEYSLSVSTDPSDGGSVDPTEGTYEEGTEVTVEASSNEGWSFSDWSGDIQSEDNPLTFEITEDINLTANFSEDSDTEPNEYNLSVSTDPSEGGSVDPSDGTYEEGAEVTVEATANEGWQFSGWGGDIESDENPLTFTIEEDTDLTANFSEVQPTEYDLSVTADPSDGGSVDPTEGTYEEGTEVTVEATANEGYQFSGWTGDMESQDNPLTFEINDNTSLTANFEEQARVYSNQLKISDGSNSETLTFGMQENATSGYDQGVDVEAPPPPPAGSFYANFVIDGYNLFTDYRAVATSSVVWEMEFDTSDENTITLSWDFNPDDYYGELMLVDDPDNPSVEVNMGSESNYEVSDSSVHTLYIIQE